VPLKIIFAQVDLVSEAQKLAKVQRFRKSEHWADQPEELDRIEASILDPTKYAMRVRLGAVLDDGREISGGGSVSARSRQGIGAIWYRYRGPQLHEDPQEHERLLRDTYRVGLLDIQDAVNQMLGRDPDQHRPPRLSWDGLLTALAAVGIMTTEQELIDAPLRLVLSDAAARAIGTGQTEP
jgi:hypothetical protein